MTDIVTELSFWESEEGGAGEALLEWDNEEGEKSEAGRGSTKQI